MEHDQKSEVLVLWMLFYVLDGYKNFSFAEVFSMLILASFMFLLIQK